MSRAMIRTRSVLCSVNANDRQFIRLCEASAPGFEVARHSSLLECIELAYLASVTSAL
jgi:hypothetical protein